jgi:hypothetical protein
VSSRTPGAFFRVTADEANARRAEALKICATVNKIENLRETGKATRRFGKSQSSRANQSIAACVALWRPGKEGGHLAVGRVGPVWPEDDEGVSRR